MLFINKKKIVLLFCSVVYRNNAHVFSIKDSSVLDYSVYIIYLLKSLILFTFTVAVENITVELRLEILISTYNVWFTYGITGV